MIFLGLLLSAGTGVSWSMLAYVVSQATQSISDYFYYSESLVNLLKQNNISVSSKTPFPEIMDKMRSIQPEFRVDPKYEVFEIIKVQSGYLAYIGLACFICAFMSTTLFLVASQRQAITMRVAFLRSVLRQNIGWFDSQNSGALINNLIENVNKIQDGIGDKIMQIVQWFSCFISSGILAFIFEWQLTLVMLSVTPLMVVIMLVFGKFSVKLHQMTIKAYSKASGIAEEVLGAIRTVVAFRGESFEASRYTAELEDACQAGIKKSRITGCILGFSSGMIFLSYSLGFWYGCKLIREGAIPMGTMLTVFFACLICTMALLQGTPLIAYLTQATIAAAPICEVIDRVPEIDKGNSSGKKLKDFKGKITFKKISFTYPTRRDCPVLTDMSIDIHAGQTVAFVGSSGCGKSSLIQLVQRFYDPDDGEILLDDVNINELNIKWLREQIGVVSQEPVLFDTTIRENIQYGRMDVTDEEIDQVLEVVNAKQMIDKLPCRLDTFVGEGGTQLSGGQKQRIAIARALVKNPKILILDEATSALDTESQRIIQTALDKSSKGRTTIIIAHRLTTVRNADVIFGIRDGCVVEKGNHEELIAQNGLYKYLVENQQVDDISHDDDLKHDQIWSAKKVTVVRPKRRSTIYSLLHPEDETGKEPNYVFKVLGLNYPERWYIMVGCFGAIMIGLTIGAFSILFGFLFQVMGNPNLEKQEADVRMYVIMVAATGVGSFISYVLQHFGFGYSGEQLTKRCRSISFKAMLRQNIGWFDEPENSIGALITRLSVEASAIRGISGEWLGLFVQGVGCIGALTIISLVFSWQIGLVLLGFVPILLSGGVLQIFIMNRFSIVDKDVLEESSKIAVQCIENIRTVTSLTREDTFIQHYKDTISKLNRNMLKLALLQGITYGITQSAIYLSFASAFLLGGYLLQQNRIETKDLFICIRGLVFGSISLAAAMVKAPDYAKGKLAAADMFQLLNRVPPIDSNSPRGAVLNLKREECFIEAENVHFRYPLRPDIKVMDGISLRIEPSQTIALVGPSGCGKSTIIQLLLRFYDATSGTIRLQKEEIPAINLRSLRQTFSLVSQEPTLFSYSIRQNIAYADTEGVYTDEQIIAAAKASNIHDFISELPDKYDTKVGEKGSNFSGGQKQRIAIARALLPDPKILLLDEAISALDTESEKIVQSALEKAQEGRTCLVIAHKLATVQNADRIIVMSEGKIAETGTHWELIAQNGIYKRMVELESERNDASVPIEIT